MARSHGVEDLAAVPRIQASEDAIGTEDNHPRSSTTRPAVPERVVSIASQISSSR